MIAKKYVAGFIMIAFSTLIASAQDIVRRTDGLELHVKIITNSPESISFERGNKGIPIYIVKSQIDEIRFENGTVEKVPHKEYTLEEIKNYAAQMINDYGLEANSSKKLRATFEDNKLRLTELGSDGKPDNDGLLFDLKKIIRFDEVGYRPGNVAFVNIWTMFSKKGTDWSKYKLVIRANDYEKAELISDALKQLSKALKNG